MLRVLAACVGHSVVVQTIGLKQGNAAISKVLLSTPAMLYGLLSER